MALALFTVLVSAPHVCPVGFPEPDRHLWCIVLRGARWIAALPVGTDGSSHSVRSLSGQWETAANAGPWTPLLTMVP